MVHSDNEFGTTNMDNQGPKLAGVTVAFLAFSIATVLLRCYVRAFLSRSFGYDDWLILATLLLYIVYSCFVLAGVHYGTGQHAENLTAHQFSSAMKVSSRT